MNITGTQLRNIIQKLDLRKVPMFDMDQKSKNRGLGDIISHFWRP